jgi:hypothetical protein
MSNSKKRNSRIVHYITRSEARQIKALCVSPAKEWGKCEKEKKQRSSLCMFIKKRAFKWKIKAREENFISFILEIRRRAFSMPRYKKRVLPALPIH